MLIGSHLTPPPESIVGSTGTSTAPVSTEETLPTPIGRTPGPRGGPPHPPLFPNLKSKGLSVMPTEPSNFTVSSVRPPNVSIALSWTPLHWPSGFRPTASRVRSTTWIRKLVANTRCRSRISRPARVIRLAASIVNWCHSRNSLHGSLRRSEPAQRNAGDDNFETDIVWNRVEHSAGRVARGHPAGDVLSRLAGGSGRARHLDGQ